MVHAFHLRLLVLAVVVSAAGCFPRMVVPEAARGAPSMAIEDDVDGVDWRIGPHRILDFEEDWESKGSISRSQRVRYQRFVYVPEQGDPWVVECKGDRRYPSSVKWPSRMHGTLEVKCDLRAPAGDRVHLVVSRDGSSPVFVGHLDTPIGRLPVESLHDFEGGRVPTPDPLGYRIGLPGQPLAVAEVGHRVWFLDAAAAAPLLGAAMSALMLVHPSGYDAPR